MKKIMAMVLSTVLTVGALCACGSGAGAGERGENTELGRTQGDTGAVASGDTAQQKAGQPKSMALLLSGPANDQGWNAVAVNGLNVSAEKYGLETTIMENVQIADMQAAYRQLAADGYDIIIGHGYQFGEAAAKVSPEFPDKYFLATESDAHSDNMASYVMACEQGAYVMGKLSAGMSKSHTIGVIGGVEQPSIIKEVEAFKKAAVEHDPQTKVIEIYLNSFTDTSLGYESAMTMIGQGADVIYQVANQAGNGAIKACQEKGIFACGNSYDQNGIAPGTVLASTIYNMDQVMLNAVGSIFDGSFKGGVYNLGMDKKVVEISGYHELESKIPQDLRDQLADTVRKITAGELSVPVLGQKNG